MFSQWFLYIRPKLLKLAHKKFSKILDAEGGANFASLGWGKKGKEPIFFQNPRGDQSLTHYGMLMCELMRLNVKKSFFDHLSYVIWGNLNLIISWWKGDLALYNRSLLASGFPEALLVHTAKYWKKFLIFCQKIHLIMDDNFLESYSLGKIKEWKSVFQILMGGPGPHLAFFVFCNVVKKNS